MYVSQYSEFAQLAAGHPARRDGVKGRASHVGAGRALYRNGDTATRMFQVVHGILRLSRVMPNGRRQVVAFGYPGDFCGFPVDGRHTSDCEALVDALVVPYRRECLESGCTDTKLHERLVAAALSEIGGMQDQLMMLGRKSADEKVASFILVLMHRCGRQTPEGVDIELPMSRTDIADFLGLTTETVSRTLSQFRHAALIKLRDIHCLTILEPARLQEVAEGE